MADNDVRADSAQHHPNAGKTEQAHTEGHFLLVKRGLYYRPDNQGYTGLKVYAGRYREVDALGLDGVIAIHEDDALVFAPSCWGEVKDAYLTRVIAEMLAALVETTDDLESEIEARRGTVLDRTMDRDLVTVRRARAAIAKARGLS